jgi:hypothetical protein
MLHPLAVPIFGALHVPISGALHVHAFMHLLMHLVMPGARYTAVRAGVRQRNPSNSYGQARDKGDNCFGSHGGLPD